MDLFFSLVFEEAKKNTLINKHNLKEEKKRKHLNAFLKMFYSFVIVLNFRLTTDVIDHKTFVVVFNKMKEKNKLKGKKHNKHKQDFFLV